VVGQGQGLGQGQGGSDVLAAFYLFILFYFILLENQPKYSILVEENLICLPSIHPFGFGDQMPSPF
jgi:hypothetical protein